MSHSKYLDYLNTVHALKFVDRIRRTEPLKEPLIALQKSEMYTPTNVPDSFSIKRVQDCHVICHFLASCTTYADARKKFYWARGLECPFGFVSSQ